MYSQLNQFEEDEKIRQMYRNTAPAGGVQYGMFPGSSIDNILESVSYNGKKSCGPQSIYQSGTKYGSSTGKYGTNLPLGYGTLSTKGLYGGNSGYKGKYVSTTPSSKGSSASGGKSAGKGGSAAGSSSSSSSSSSGSSGGGK